MILASRDELEISDDVDSSFCCSITHDVFVKPAMVLVSGHTYSRLAILKHVSQQLGLIVQAERTIDLDNPAPRAVRDPKSNIEIPLSTIANGSYYTDNRGVGDLVECFLSVLRESRQQ